MRPHSVLPVLLAALVLPGSAQAALRDLCTARPSLGSSACIVDQGHALIEFGAADWELDKTPEERSDVLIAGDALLRYGLTATSEVQLGWAAFGRSLTHDYVTGARTRRSGVGDVTLAFRQNLRNPDGSGTSYGLQPFVTLPTGRSSIGAGTWGAGLIVPLGFDLQEGVSVMLNPEGDAQPDEDGKGRHLRYGTVTGLQVALSKAVSATFELSTFRDREPGDHSSETLAAISSTWQTGDNLQFDAAVVAGLNHTSPDVRLLTGVSARF
jgi:hypothetical protein